MKTVFIAMMIGLLGLTHQDKPQLNGNYRVEFDRKYELGSFKINFNGDTFEKIMPDAVSYKGKIKYEKYKTQIRVNADDNPIELDNREFGKDTMLFLTKNKTDLSRILYRGKMIKIK